MACSQASEAVMGIKTDANLNAVQYSWLTTIVYLCELVCMYPFNRMFQSLPVAKIICIAVICWGIVVSLTAVCHDFIDLMVVRGLLGMLSVLLKMQPDVSKGAFETAIQPGFLTVTSLWYIRGEQAQTIAYWYSMNGLTSIFTGLLTYGCSQYKGVIKSWQLMFLILGLLTFSWGCFALWWVPDSPTRAKCFSDEDKRLMVERMRQNQHLINNSSGTKCERQFSTHTCIVLSTLPSGGIGAYNGLITNALGFSVLQVDLLAMASGAVTLCCIFGAVFFYRWTRWTIGTAALCILPQIACVVTMMTVTPNAQNKGGVLIAYYLFYFNQAQIILLLSLTSQNVAGGTKKAIAVACTWAGAMVGNMIGPQVFAMATPPRYIKGFAVSLGVYCAMSAILLYLYFSYRTINRSRDKARVDKRGSAEERPEDLDMAFDDLTDRENVNFRYNI
ncbi:hypothetical protein EHS25_000939 [Saitozyma podzolica]|uniref:Major facilitator superfamily (MFS) profile domain-containing protein n=1 Tax=Saitozyma podzolica TaxID=1890683 RepID=A0A427YXN6_9TREE|nr:hypothetical protein EHS25_000939 [Saitozyma podzolica]